MTDPARKGIKERLLAGETLVGTFIQTPHPVICEFTGAMGFDFLCLEAEHSAMGAETITALVAATSRTASAALVRLANNDWDLVAGALDSGAEGVICPRVNSGAEAETFVRSALYPPVGDRGIGPGRVTGYGLNSGPGYRAQANQTNLVAAQVETRAAIEHLDDILATPGLDLVFVGPADLASSLGIDRGFDHPDLRVAIQDIVDRAHAAGKKTGIFAGNAAQAAYWVERGVQLILLASDLIFLIGGASAQMAELKRLIAEQQPVKKTRTTKKAK
jgi:4-hydroxy-2-oxoheptanedioate aldolase